MSTNNNHNSIVNETRELLENAQREVLQEINTKRSFFVRLFSNKETNNLQQVQSHISKALNQLKKIGADDNGMVSKLQNHLNDKASVIKKLEEQFERSGKESSELRDRIRFYEQEVTRLKEQSISTEVDSAKINEQKLEEDFKAKIQALEDAHREVENRFKASQEDLRRSQEMTVEFSQRIKRIKSEITSK